MRAIRIIPLSFGCAVMYGICKGNYWAELLCSFIPPLMYYFGFREGVGKIRSILKDLYE